MSTHAARPGGSAIAAVLLGVVLGAACQLQQARLWPVDVYAAGTLLTAGLLLLALRGQRGVVLRWLAVLIAAAALSGAITGWRAASYAAQGLSRAVEGRDLVVTGVVASMPHRNEAGLRFRFEPESARAGSLPVRLPARLLLGWYGGPEPLADGSLAL